MKVTLEYLKEIKTCPEGIEYFKANKLEGIKALKLIKQLINEKHYKWTSWFLSRSLNNLNKVKYIIYAAELVLHIFEDKYPDDECPKKAIEAAKTYLKNPNKKNADAAVDAGDAGDATADAAAAADAEAAYAAATVATYAAYAAAAAAAYAAYAYTATADAYTATADVAVAYASAAASAATAAAKVATLAAASASDTATLAADAAAYAAYVAGDAAAADAEAYHKILGYGAKLLKEQIK